MIYSYGFIFWKSNMVITLLEKFHKTFKWSGNILTELSYSYGMLYIIMVSYVWVGEISGEHDSLN